MRVVDEDTGGSGQSEVIDVVLVFGISIIGIAIILATGAPVIDDARENAQIERIQNEFSLLSQEVRESVYTPSESSASISISEGGIEGDPDSLNVTIEYRNETASPTATQTETIRLGGLLYEETDSSVAYQMGGVMATRIGGGSYMNTPPEIDYYGTGLTMDLINITSDRTFAGSGSTVGFRYEGTNRSETLTDLSNSSLGAGTLNVTFETRYERGWGNYLNSTFGESQVDTTVPDGVSVNLTAGPPVFGVEYLYQRYGGSFPSVAGFTDPIFVYDSGIGTPGDYNYTQESSGILGSALDLPVSDGDIDRCVVSVGGPNLPSSGSVVTAGDYQGDRDLDGHDFDTSGGPIRFTATDPDVTVQNNPIEFDTSGGAVKLYVQGNFEIDDTVSGPDIFINGSNPVYVFVQGNVDLGDSFSIDIEGNRTELFQIYTKASSINVGGSADYQGTLYAPEGDIEITSGTVFRGAAIAAGGGVSNPVSVDGEYYHDADLREAQLPDCINPPVTNFNVAERRVALR